MGKIDLWTQTIFERRYLGVGTTSVCLRQMLANAKVVNGYSNESTRWATVSRAIWVDGGFDGEPFMRWMDVCRWIVQVVLRQKQTKGFACKKRWVVERTFGWMMSTRRLRV